MEQDKLQDKSGKSTDISPEEIAEQASKPDHDQIFRQPKRGDESKGEPDDRDVAGAVDHEDTPHGREEIKHQIEKDSPRP